MLKLGLLDFDTSHVTAFTTRLHHVDVEESQWVEGARIVIACPGQSTMMPQRIPKLTKAMTKLGVPLVDDPREMIGKVDGVLIESLQGSAHFERAKPFLDAGIPCFIDKPFACSVDDAKRIAELAEKRNVPVFSTSALRYTPELTAYLEDETHGAIQGALTYGPVSTNEGNPGLYHYGIHTVEMLYALMGSGCERVTTIHTSEVDVVTGEWSDGRVATMRGVRKGSSGYGFVAFSEKGTQSVPLPTREFYRELLKKIVGFFQTAKSPVPMETTVEVIGFIEAANASAVNDGRLEKIRK